MIAGVGTRASLMAADELDRLPAAQHACEFFAIL